MFWTIAGVVLFIGAVITLLPLLRGKSAWQPVALALAFALPAAGLWLYDSFGTPEGIGIHGRPQVAAGAANPADPHTGQAAADMQSAIEGLRARLAAAPDDLEGWLLLARTLRSQQQFAEAADALEQAHALAPENPVVMADLAEAWIYTTPDGRVPQDSRVLLERALDIEPNLQKGLWLMGIAAMQDGDDAFAISYWQNLLEQLEPGSNVHTMVADQVNEAQARMGMAPQMPMMPAGEESPAQATAVAADDDGSWNGTRLVLDAVEGAREALDNGAVLYIMIRAPGPAMGPPLGVRRIMGPSFPLEVTIDDNDSMLQERPISSEAEIQVQARVSLSGAPGAQPGDWQSAAKSVERATASLVVLEIDQQVE